MAVLLLGERARRFCHPAPERLHAITKIGVSVTTQYGICGTSVDLPVQALDGRSRQVCQTVGTELPAT